MRHLGTEYLETDRLILRRFRVEDAKFIYENWASDDNVTKYLRWKSHKSPEITNMLLKEWVSNYGNKDYYRWAVVLKENYEHIGGIRVNSIDDTINRSDISFCIGSKWWNKGYATEALKCVINFLINEVGMQRIEARNDPENARTVRVFEKCNMQEEGRLRRAGWNNQGVCDACYYSILSE